MQYEVVALGGTFDIIHVGHIALLKEGFSISKKVIIGLTSDEFALKNVKFNTKQTDIKKHKKNQALNNKGNSQQN